MGELDTPGSVTPPLELLLAGLARLDALAAEGGFPTLGLALLILLLGVGIRDFMTWLRLCLIFSSLSCSFMARRSFLSLKISSSLSSLFLESDSKPRFTFRSSRWLFWYSSCSFPNSADFSSRAFFSFCHLAVASVLACRSTLNVRISSLEFALASEARDSLSSIRSFSFLRLNSWASERSLALDSWLFSWFSCFTVSSRFLERILRCAEPRLIRRTLVANLSAKVVSSYDSL
mmetsp:Transcript_23620/g.55827  ORF Transcript_23620/g.55827 Transcript_23620/m.55827 type:complete len:233 (-) Transcript_23620:2982-3680(-)